MKSMIVAIDKNNGIAVDNDLPWGRDLPDDLAYFKKMTQGASVIMGRKTFDSLKGPLPNRENIVVSSKPTGVTGVLTASSLEAAYALARYPVFVIGGGQIYAAALKDMDTLYITEVNAEFPAANVFFPQINYLDFEEVSRNHHDADERNKYAFDFVLYKRRLS